MSVMTVDDVAKKRAVAKPEPEPARKPMILQVRGSDEFKEWYDALARFDGLTPTALFDRAIRQYAKQVGFTQEPPLR